MNDDERRVSFFPPWLLDLSNWLPLRLFSSHSNGKAILSLCLDRLRLFGRSEETLFLLLVRLDLLVGEAVTTAASSLPTPPPPARNSSRPNTRPSSTLPPVLEKELLFRLGLSPDERRFVDEERPTFPLDWEPSDRRDFDEDLLRLRVGGSTAV